MKKKLTLKILCIVFAPLLYINNGLAHGPLPIEIAPIDISRFPPVEDDIKAMAQYGKQAQQAGQRLVERGINALESIHQALQNPQNFQQKMQLITVLGEIGESDSVDVILQATKKSDNQYLYQNALLALPKFEQQNKIIAFVNRQLANKQQSSLAVRSALNYYISKPQPDALQWVKQYNQPDTRDDVRYVALYLGGILGDESIKQDIINLLQNRQALTREYYLLLGLAEITSLDEFTRLLSQLDIDLSNREKAIKYATFRKSPADKQSELAEEFLKGADSTLRRAAVNHLVKTKNADVLGEYWKNANALVRNSVKRAGYNIHIEDDKAVLEKRSQHSTKNYKSLIWVLLVIVTITGFYAYLQKIYLRKRK